jgi:hypothetical protein
MTKHGETLQKQLFEFMMDHNIKVKKKDESKVEPRLQVVVR